MKQSRLNRLRWWLAWRIMTNNDRCRIWFYFMFWQRVAATLPRRLGTTWWELRNKEANEEARSMLIAKVGTPVEPVAVKVKEYMPPLEAARQQGE